MRKANPDKARKGTKKARSGPKKSLKQVDLGVVRGQITNMVGNGALEMVETTMEEVNKGHYLGMKYLFEMVGLCPATTSEEAQQDDSLAKTLLRRLGLPEDSNLGTEVTSECVTKPVEQQSDAVE
jgi:hypothetical protein